MRAPGRGCGLGRQRAEGRFVPMAPPLRLRPGGEAVMTGMLLQLLLRQGIVPRRVSGTHGGEYHSPCPVCGGRDRFHVWPERAGPRCAVPGMWGCRGCDTGGDVIAYLCHCKGMRYADACRHLGIRPASLPLTGRDAGFIPRQVELPPVQWRERATVLVKKAHSLLLRTPDAMDWLAARGIERETVIRHRLGWLCRGDKAWISARLEDWGLRTTVDDPFFRYPRGLLIPRYLADETGSRQVAAMRIRRLESDRRRFAPEAKYMAFKGSASFPLLLLPEKSAADVPLVIVESELDAMLVDAACRSHAMVCGVLGLASNTAKPHAAAHAVCRSASILLLSLDADQPGSGGARSTDKALIWWKRTYPQAVDWPVPMGKDPGEAVRLGLALPVWIAAGLPRRFRGDLAGAGAGVWAAHGWSVAPDAGLGLEPVGSRAATATPGLANGSGRVSANQEVAPPLALPRSHDLPPQRTEPDIRVLWEIMRRYPIRLGVREHPAFFAILAPAAWKRIHWERYARIADFILGSRAVDTHLSAHPVREGVIDAQNLIVIPGGRR